MLRIEKVWRQESDILNFLCREPDSKKSLPGVFSLPIVFCVALCEKFLCREQRKKKLSVNIETLGEGSVSSSDTCFLGGIGERDSSFSFSTH
jgi:hypothetical protein